MRVLLICCCMSACFAALPPFYHTSKEVKSIVSSWESETLRLLPTLAVDAVLISASPHPRTLIMCGDHPRELITVETCLELIRKARHQDVGTLLVVFNANPDARAVVEAGESCLRTNLQGVDTNRNWDAFWQTADCRIEPSSCPGEKPMSEPQVLEERDLMASLDPDIVVAIHSGFSKILTPYAYDQVGAPADVDSMMELLESVSDADCEIGPSGEVLGYDCPGSILDYAYLNTNALVTAVFEIYDGSQHLESFLADDFCFHNFNPGSLESFKRVVHAWSDKVLKLVATAKSSRSSLRESMQFPPQ